MWCGLGAREITECFAFTWYHYVIFNLHYCILLKCQYCKSNGGGGLDTSVRVEAILKSASLQSCHYFPPGLRWPSQMDSSSSTRCQHQVILLDDRGTSVLKTCPESLHESILAGSQSSNLSFTAPMFKPLHNYGTVKTGVHDYHERRHFNTASNHMACHVTSAYWRYIPTVYVLL